MKLDNIYSKCLIDKAAENDGVWADLGEFGKYKIARYGTAAYRKLFMAMVKPYKFAMDNDTLPEGKDEELLAACIAKGLIKDWEMQDNEGNALSYDEDRMKQMLIDLPILRAKIIDFSQAYENYLQATLEETAKN